MINDHATSTQLVTKTHGLGQGAPWVVHERFKPRGTTNTSAGRMRRSPKPIAPHKRIVTTEYGPA